RLIFLGRFLSAARTVHLRVAPALIGHSAAEHFGDGWRDTHRAAFLKRFLHCFGNLFGFGFIGLRRCEHHHKKCEQQGDEIRVGNPPALVIFVFHVPFARHGYSLAGAGAATPIPSFSAFFLALPACWRNASSLTRISFGFMPSTMLHTPSSSSSWSCAS